MKLIALLNEMVQEDDSWEIFYDLSKQSRIPVLRVTIAISALFLG